MTVGLSHRFLSAVRDPVVDGTIPNVQNYLAIN